MSGNLQYRLAVILFKFKDEDIIMKFSAEYTKIGLFNGRIDKIGPFALQINFSLEELNFS